MFQHPVETAIQAIFLGHREIGSQQCIHGGGQVPLAMHTKFAAWIQQSVHNQELQYFFPSDVFARSGKASIPKLIQAQLLPQLTSQPAATEQTRAPQFEAAQFHLQAVDRIDGNLAIVGEQTQVRILLLLIVKHRQRFAPCRLLLIVDLAEIENGSLHRLVGSDAMVFYDAEVAMILAVFLAMDAAQKHADSRLPELRCQREETWSSLYRFFRKRR